MQDIIAELTWRGLIHQSTDEAELQRRLAERPCVVYAGFDPTADSLHVGHLVALMMLRCFQRAGHRPIALVGGATGMIGDPTGKSETRRPLSRETVRANAETYPQQVFKVLDPTRTDVRFNSEWMDRMTAGDVIRLCAHYTVARMLERDDFAKRYREGRPIGVHEFLYPLVQGYDSVALQADVEVGGTDQHFNLLVGRDLLKAYGLPPQIILTLPLLEGTDGVQKMSKSLSNAIGIAEPPDEIFGKVMSISDTLMLRYYEMLTRDGVATLRSEIESGAMHPMRAKQKLAQSLVARVYDDATARRSAEEFQRRFQRRELPSDVVTFDWPESDVISLALPRVLTVPGLAASMSEARRLIRQGAVRVGGQRIEDIDYRIVPSGQPIVVQVGARRVRAIRFLRESST